MLKKPTGQSNSPHQSSFWFGFALGSITLAGAAFLFGTKKGRKTLQKMLDMSENLEDNLMSAAKEFEVALEERGEDLKKVIEKVPSQAPTSSLASILNKMKIFGPQTTKSNKKFFTKE